MENVNNLKRTKVPYKEISSDGFVRVCSILGIAAITVLGILGWQHGIFETQDTFARFIRGLGWASIPVFILVQAVQVVLPILPGAIGCSVGVIVFGPLWGFVYNYIGICAGSILAFLLARSYGLPLVRKMVPHRQLEKYYSWLSRGKAFERFFTIAIVAPVAPDDLLCYLAGLTPISFRKFTAIILLGKPCAIFLYSIGLTAVVSFFWQ